MNALFTFQAHFFGEKRSAPVALKEVDSGLSNSFLSESLLNYSAVTFCGGHPNRKKKWRTKPSAYGVAEMSQNYAVLFVNEMPLFKSLKVKVRLKK